MAKQSLTDSKLHRLARLVEDEGADPIGVIQQRVMRAHAICKALGLAAEPITNDEADLASALFGLGDLLNEIFLDLDPTEFRALVLAGETEEVAHA